jgi:hypothetical protein
MPAGALDQIRRGATAERNAPSNAAKYPSNRIGAHTATVDAQSLATALHREALRRSLALPDRLTRPHGLGWPAGYARIARETPQLAERDLEAALVTAGRLIDPVLMGGIAGRWNPGLLSWR